MNINFLSSVRSLHSSSPFVILGAVWILIHSYPTYVFSIPHNEIFLSRSHLTPVFFSFSEPANSSLTDLFFSSVMEYSFISRYPTHGIQSIYHPHFVFSTVHHAQLTSTPSTLLLYNLLYLCLTSKLINTYRKL